jgi:hypothetical protein
MKSKQKQLKKAERAWYRAKALAEQAADLVSDCERKVARLREALNCAEVPGTTRPQSRRRKQITKKLKGMLIEVNGALFPLSSSTASP